MHVLCVLLCSREAGKLFTVMGTTVHYFCMLFTFNSSQLGLDTEKLFSFYGGEVTRQVKAAQKRR